MRSAGVQKLRGCAAARAVIRGGVAGCVVRGLLSFVVLLGAAGCGSGSGSSSSENSGSLLTLVEVQRDGLEGDTTPESLAVSPDGANVYVFESHNPLVVFRRDTKSGALTLVQRMADALPLVRTSTGVAVSPDGAHVYIAGFTLALHPLAVFRRAGKDGALAFVQRAGEGHRAVGHSGVLAVSPDGANVYLAVYEGPGIVVFSRDVTTGALSFVQDRTFDCGFQPAHCRAGSVAVSPDGANVYATEFSGGVNRVVVLRRDAATGTLSLVETQDAENLREDPRGNFKLEPGESLSPRALALSADGANVYVSWETGGKGPLTVFRRDPASGRLSLVQLQAGVARRLLNLAVSPDGAFVYGAASEAGLAVFRRDAASGSVTFLGLEDALAVGEEPADAFASGVAVSPDSSSLYVTHADANAVVVYRVNRGKERAAVPVIPAPS